MKVKKEYIFLIIVIAALSVYLIMRNTDKTHYRLPILPEIAGKDISKIEIIRKGSTITLHRKDEEWFIGSKEYKADKEKVGKMLETIGKLMLTALVSESENYTRYDLGDEKKITVKAWKGDEIIRNFDMGKAAASHRHTFVRIADNENVYHALENFRSKFDDSVEEIRDKTVLSFDKNSVHEIQITKGEKSFAVTRKMIPIKVNTGQDSKVAVSQSSQEEYMWIGEDDRKLDDSKINRFLSTLSKLLCHSYLNESTKADFKDPIYTLTLKGTKQYTLSIYSKREKDAKEYPAVSSESDYPFLLPQWRVDNIMKDQDDIMKEPEK